MIQDKDTLGALGWDMRHASVAEGAHPMVARVHKTRGKGVGNRNPETQISIKPRKVAFGQVRQTAK